MEIEAALPAHERRLIHAAVIGWEQAQSPQPAISATDQVAIDQLVARRRAGHPLQHVTGEAYFRYETLQVGPGVFIPRPETEVMTGWVIDYLSSVENAVVVELCAGSGAISLALAHETVGHRQYAVEISPDAMPWLERNLATTQVQIVAGDMAEALTELNGTVDVIICNPPYVPLEAWEGLPREVRDFDPPQALFSGQDGLDAMRVLASTARRLLRPGGVLSAEHAEVQHASVIQLFVNAGFDKVVDHQDLTGRWRFITAILPKM